MGLILSLIQHADIPIAYYNVHVTEEHSHLQSPMELLSFTQMVACTDVLVTRESSSQLHYMQFSAALSWFLSFILLSVVLV